MHQAAAAASYSGLDSYIAKKFQMYPLTSDQDWSTFLFEIENPKVETLWSTGIRIQLAKTKRGHFYQLRHLCGLMHFRIFYFIPHGFNIGSSTNEERISKSAAQRKMKNMLQLNLDIDKLVQRRFDWCNFRNFWSAATAAAAAASAKLHSEASKLWSKSMSLAV